MILFMGFHKHVQVITVAGIFLCSSGAAADKPYISVGAAKAKKTVMAYQAIKVAAAHFKGQAKTIQSTVTSDLLFMDIFRFLDASAFIEDDSKSGILQGTFKYTDWTGIGAEFLVKSVLSGEGNAMTYEAHLYDTFGAKEVLAKRYVAPPSDAKTLAHTFANDIVEALTGTKGIFMSKIAMSCDRTGKKEIYIMDFDGTNVKQITSHRSIAFAPAWSPDGTKIAYSLFTRRGDNIKNIDLYEFNFATKTIRMLSNRKGINSGAAYSPDGTRIALTMSFLGNPEIFLFDTSSRTVERMTNSFGFDVDPAWSPDGKQLAFVSSRTGMPMVFNLNIDGSKIQRLTYAGRYNATPNWSPKNSKLVFSGWIDNRFDVFTINSDGSNIERLTKNQGNNEDPFFSPDGNFVAFSSNRTGQQNIYVMNIDGTYVRRLTYGLGNCVAPKWSR